MRKKVNVLLYNTGAVAVGLLISACLLLFMDVNPAEVCAQTLSKIVTDKYNLGEVLVKATPLIFTSLAFAFTYKANLFNIGAQGQFLMGSIVAVSLSLTLQDTVPTALLLLLVLVGSFAAGAAVGGLIGAAKAKFSANEFLVSMISSAPACRRPRRSICRPTPSPPARTCPTSCRGHGCIWASCWRWPRRCWCGCC